MTDPRYLNVDLEIDSPEDLTLITEELGEEVVVMFNGEWATHRRATFEIGGSLASANECIGLFCMLVETLSDEAKGLWDRSYSRTFDIGFNSGNSHADARLTIEPRILERVANIGATIAITVYPIR